MLVDWFTVAAQALNFLILVWLLKRFLYKPILNAVDAREKRIAAELADADAKKAEAQKERDAFQHKNEEFDQQRAVLLAKATADANSERQRILDDGRKADTAARAKREVAETNEMQVIRKTLVRRAQAEVFAVARKALKDLATASLEQSVSAVFIARLHELKGKPREELVKVLKAAAAPALVRSAFDLPEAQRKAIEDALREFVSADVPTQFETAPELISGIEVTVSGQKVAWSIADYLATLEQRVGEIAKDKTQAAPKLRAESAPAEAST